MPVFILHAPVKKIFRIRFKLLFDIRIIEPNYGENLPFLLYIDLGVFIALAVIERLRNADDFCRSKDYIVMITIFKRSLFAVKDIPAGEIVTENNVRSIRPGYGIAPKHLKKMLGKRAGVPLKRGEPVTQEFLEELL